MADEVDAIYLTGWEYNRLLSANPQTPRNSALPAEILWNGAAYLWLFRRVFCTAESLQNEEAADNIMGWRTGRIFGELAGTHRILEPVDWQILGQSAQKSLTDKHKILRAEYHDGADVRTLIQKKDYRKLEQIKIELVKPVADYVGAMVGVVPNSLASPSWQRDSSAPDGDVDAADRVSTFLDRLAKPVTTGLRLCDPPGTSVAPQDVQKQREVQQQQETEMIFELMAGEGRFVGGEGYVEYFDELVPYRAAYEPINAQLYTNWQQNLPALVAVRAAAAKDLWPQLHREWLPQLLADPAFANELATLIAKAVRSSSRFGDLLTLPSLIAFSVASVASGSLPPMLAELAHLNPVTASLATLVPMGMTGGAIAVASRRSARSATSVEPLAMFYQKAKRIASAQTADPSSRK